MSELDDVRRFHERFDLPHRDRPGLLPRQRLAERANFMLEELIEFAAAAGLALADDEDGETRFEVSTEPQSLAGQADALVDIVYVALGTAVQLGLTSVWHRLWDDVQRANLAKVRGASDRAHTDVVKPPGWMPPRTDDILRHAGYDPADWSTET